MPSFKAKQEPAVEGEDGEAEVCFICANPINHHSLAPCNHATCHICALRLRALYKDKNCPHCRTPAPFVIFTDDTTKRFEDYTAKDITSTDENIGIRYANEDIVGDTVLLLRYNCPDDSCDFAGLGWPDLHRHVRSVHHKKMCDLCTRNKKVFTHEHELFADKELEKHMRKGDDKPGAIDQTGFKGHPLCGFCGERFYDGDKLYEHCRNKHERCFICDRRDSRQPHYFQDYNALEKHFQKDHFLCLDRECLEKKFVVFESEIDLKAHQLSEHGNSLSKDVRRDARVVDMSGFDLRQPYHPERRGGGHGGQGSSREQRGRGRDPNSEPLPASSAQPMRRDELAFQRQMAIHSAQSVSTRTFGGQLSGNTTPAATPRPNTPSAPAHSRNPQQQLVDVMENISISDLSSLPPEQRARLTRHGAVIERATNLLGSDPTKVSTFRSHISSYNKGSMTAPQLIDSFFALFSDTSSTALGTLVREVADLFEERSKADALLRAWQNWRAINEDYPSLPGLGGMHGATTASSGWASAASASPAAANSASTAAAQQKASTRVLRLKNSTRRGSAGGIGIAAASSNASSSNAPPAFSRAVAPSSAAPSSSAFPALPGAKPTTQFTRSGNLGGGLLSYASPAPGSSSSSRSATPAASSTGYRRPAAPAVAGSTRDAFPSLPPAPKPLTTIFGYGRGAVRRDVGSKNTGFAWGGGSSTGEGSGGQGGNADADNETGGKGKKKKKQILAQWG
ncbi:zinc finger protein [Coniochaeta sp. 2T2.1]|nr:zinc finger protein [Coniochaeta sp. 2T2.1]